VIKVAVGLVLAAAVAAAATASAPTALTVRSCAPGTLRVVATDATRCLLLEQRVRIRLTYVATRSYETTAKRHALPKAAVRRIVADPASRLLTGGETATGLRSSAECDPFDGRADVRLSWKPAGTRGTQRVVATIYPDGIEKGRFESSVPLAPDVSTLEWVRVHGQARHTWAVLTLREDGWTVSETDVFVGPGCAIDSP
jgi:hypothetical protein